MMFDQDEQMSPRGKPRITSCSVALTMLICTLHVEAFGQVASVAVDDRENWNLATVKRELAKLTVRKETECSKNAISEGWRDLEPQIQALHGGRYSPYDGVCFPNFNYVDIDHIVSRVESDESGLCDRTLEERKKFAIDLLNLTFAPNSLNASKGKRDAGEIAIAERSKFRDALTDDGKCFWAAQTVRVKSKYDLSVDVAERDALLEILDACETFSIHPGRPQAPVGCDWAFRPEFVSAVAEADSAPSVSCSETLETETWRAAIQYAPEIACIATPEVGSQQPQVLPISGQGESRVNQIAAQKACKAKIGSITCSKIKEQCPSVTAGYCGEPLYQPKPTNGRWHDSDDNGLNCEGL